MLHMDAFPVLLLSTGTCVSSSRTGAYEMSRPGVSFPLFASIAVSVAEMRSSPVPFQASVWTALIIEEKSASFACVK